MYFGAVERNKLEPEPRDATAAPVPMYRPAGGATRREAKYGAGGGTRTRTRVNLSGF